MRFVPYAELDGVPNVIVDGAATEATLLTLSHWPGSRVPASLRADLSAEIAVRYLEQPAMHVPADVVSNNHFDEDGVRARHGRRRACAPRPARRCCPRRRLRLEPNA